METGANSTITNLSEQSGHHQSNAMPSSPAVQWQVEDIRNLLDLPLQTCSFRRRTVHRTYHDANAVQRST
jgi:hypothetical protein